MKTYETAADETRRIFVSMLEQIGQFLYAPFSNWSDFQKMLLIGILLVALVAIGTWPPRRKRRYADPTSGKPVVLACACMLGVFVMGMPFSSL